MAKILLTDGICRITFDSSTIEDLILTPAGPNAKYMTDKSDQGPFASIGVENIGIEEFFERPVLKEKGIHHFSRIISNLDPHRDWAFKKIQIPRQFAKMDAEHIKTEMEWNYALLNHERSEAVCAFCKINDDCICYVASIFHAGDESDDAKAAKIWDLIRSIRPK